MKQITLCVLFILISSLVLNGITTTAQAETDLSILLKITKHAQKQLESQINQDSSDKIKQLFKEGTQEIEALEKSLSNNDSDLAKKHFLLAMKIFKELSQQLTDNQSTQTTMTNNTLQDPSTELLRLQKYIDNLRSIAKKYNATISFSELDTLFVTAKNQITDKQFDDVLQTISKIKQITINLNNEIRSYSSQQEQSRATEYAQKYLEQLDRLIENAKNQGISENIIQKLETTRDDLSLATDPHDIIKQIREIISIKEQFELTKNDRLESRIMQIEKTLLELSNSEKLSQTELDDSKKTLQTIKDHIVNGDFETANELLRSLVTLLEQFRD
jgi:hypothetical protein